MAAEINTNGRLAIPALAGLLVTSAFSFVMSLTFIECIIVVSCNKYFPTTWSGGVIDQ